MLPELEDTLAAVPGATPANNPGTGPAAPLQGPGHVERTATAPRSVGPGGAPGLAAGQQLGHFRIERQLGAGGMGEVYLATDLALERPVAIKVLPDGTSRDSARRERLVREARSQARITHPNVGHIYFIGEEAGRLYFAMEYVAGQTLAERVAAGPLTVDDALSVICSVALGLREAQRHGITHRDIKPSNMMIDAHGIVKVLDFGLAAGALGAVEAGPVAQTTLGGTPLYMAPEQARGEPIDFRADIYALGATLFHLVSGRPPFEADTLEALLSKHSSAERPSLPRRSGQARTTIAAVAALCGRMMAPAAADRFASYDELIRALELASVEHMRPAGLWVRAMAAFVDLMIASVIMAVFAIPIGLLFDVGGDFGPHILTVYGLYRAIFVARGGRTVGLWLFELEVIDTTTGNKPSLRRSALRVAVPLALPLFTALLSELLQWLGYGMIAPVHIPLIVLSCWPPVSLLWASLRSVAKQTVWDKISHTAVRYRARRTNAL